MPTVDERYEGNLKILTTYHRLAGIALGVVTPPSLTFHMVRRLISVDEETEEVSANEESTDPLAQLLVEAASSMAFSEETSSHVMDVDASASLAALFDGDAAKSLKPRLFVAISVRATSSSSASAGDEDARICGLLTTCEWTRDATLGTERFTQKELSKLGAPRLDSSWLLIDVVASKRRGCGVLLALQAYLLACKSRQYHGVVALAVTRAGRQLFEKLGFATHAYREGGVSKALCYARAGSLSLMQIRRRLAFPGSTTLLESYCYREGVRDADKIYSRC